MSLDPTKQYFTKYTDSRLGSGFTGENSGLTVTEEIDTKQDVLEFNTTYDATTNKVATMADVPDAQIQSDWNQSDNTAKDYIKNKPTNLVHSGTASGSANQADFNANADTVHNKAQVLSATQQGQARKNINAANIDEAVICIESNSAPISSTTTYTDSFGTSRNYKVGDQVKVYDSTEGKYKIYTLFNINNGTATWEKSNNVTVTNTVNINLLTYVNGVNTIGTELIGVVVTLTNTTDSEVVGTHTIVSGETSCSFTELNPLKDYSVSVSSISGYTQPAAQTISGIGVGVSVTKTFQYEADEYTISITSDQGASDPAISEAVVTINSIDYENGDTIKFAAGTSQSDIESAISTTTINRYNNAVTVNTTNKTITSAYVYVPLGNFIFERKGGLYTAAQWTTALNNGEVSNDDVIGIAVLTEDAEIVSAFELVSGKKQIYNAQTAPTGMTAVGISDLDGETNTLLMLNTYSTDSTYAAGAARNVQLSNGQKCYLPAIGQQNIISTHNTEIVALLTACGKSNIIDNDFYWTSSYWGTYNSTQQFYRGLFSGSDINNSANITGSNYVLPIATWKPISTKLHFTATDNSSVANMVLEITDQSSNIVYVKTGSDGDCYLSLDNGTYTVYSFSHSLSIGTFIVTNANVMTTVNISATKMEYVDLGLSVNWATCNLGADSPTETGDYFSWGNIIGHAKGSGYSFDQTTYNSTPGASLTANISSSDSAHDAALAIKGSPWRIPTKAECDELIGGCTATNVTIDGVNGKLFKSNISGYTDKKIFIPASGYYQGTTLYSEGSHGYTWGSSYSSNKGCYMAVRTSELYTDYNVRYEGLPVRPVQ